MAADKNSSGHTAGVITADQACKLLMLSNERIRQLVKSGYIQQESRGKYNLVGVVQGYIRFLKDEERRTTRVSSESRVRDARAQEIELRMAEKRRELVPLEDATAAFDLVVGKVKEEFSGLPARTTRDIPLRRKIEEEINGSLGRVAESLRASAEFLRTGGELPHSDTDNDT